MSGERVNPASTCPHAQWLAKRVFFQGKANGPHSADIELMIYRTVRFDDDDLAR